MAGHEVDQDRVDQRGRAETADDGVDLKREFDATLACQHIYKYV